MAKYFLGSVGEATAFRMKNGEKQFMFHATSLTDQGINITSSQDEIRAGQGAPIVATFNHDASVQVTLTDVFWKPEYVEAKLGGSFAANANDYQSEEGLTADANGDLTLKLAPITAYLPCSNGATYLIWYTVEGADDWHAYEGTVTGNKLAGFTANTNYCVRYLAQDVQARELWVTSDILPSELYLVIKTPIYAGDACAASNGNIAGHITFEIPRYKLDPTLDLSFAMSSNITMSLSGSALGYTTGCNENGSKLMRIVETIIGREWFADLAAIYIDPAFIPSDGATVPVYGVYKNGSVALLKDDAKAYAEAAPHAETYAFTFGPTSSASNTITVTAAVYDKTGNLILQDTDSIVATGAQYTVGEHTGVLTEAE